MSKENTENKQTETPVPLEPWVKEMQLADDDLDAVMGGMMMTECYGYRDIGCQAYRS